MNNIQGLPLQLASNAQGASRSAAADAWYSAIDVDMETRWTVLVNQRALVNRQYGCQWKCSQVLWRAGQYEIPSLYVNLHNPTHETSTAPRTGATKCDIVMSSYCAHLCAIDCLDSARVPEFHVATTYSAAIARWWRDKTEFLAT